MIHPDRDGDSDAETGKTGTQVNLSWRGGGKMPHVKSNPSLRCRVPESF